MNYTFLILCFIASIFTAVSISTEDLGITKECACDEPGNPSCEIDGYVGNTVIYEDDSIRVWNFTLAPGAMTSMHKHDYDYHFVAIQPTQLEVYGEDGSRLFDFRAEGVLGFQLSDDGQFLEPIGIELPWPVPSVHAAKNIGDEDYYEILFESKKNGSGQIDPSKMSEIINEL